MTEVKWIKITVTMFDDEKIDFIESLPEADAILIIWIKLLALAGRCNFGGLLMLTPTLPYNEEMLAHNFKRPISIVRLAMRTFMELGMVEVGNMGYFISNWEKHQNEEKMSTIREYNRLKKQQQRDKKKLLGTGKNPDVSPTSQGLSPPCQDTEVERDKEEDIDITSTSTTIESMFVQLLDYYCEKVGVIQATPNDIALSKQLIEIDKIPYKIIISAIDNKMLKRKPKHSQDKIRSLSYFEGCIRDEWEIEKAKVVKTGGSDKGTSEQNIQQSGIGITFDD